MKIGPDLDALSSALTGLAEFAGVGSPTLTMMPVNSLVHDHVAVDISAPDGRPVLLRVPKQSQFGLPAAENLAYQAACFERVSRSGHGPRLYGCIQPSAEVPMGALVVERIFGRLPRLPDDLPALAEVMAKVHALPVVPPQDRPPLADHRDPVGGAMAEIERQAKFLDEAGLQPAARAEIEAELDWARGFAASIPGRTQPVTLVLTDTHPGNFFIEPSGRAVIVDLEKVLYGSPGTDLAHATVYSSTTWDPGTWADLSLGEVSAFYRHYLAITGPELAVPLLPWLVPMRRLLFLRAITWCAKWSVLHHRHRLDEKHRAETTEDWSAENTDPAVIDHVAGRVAEYLSPAVLARMRAEWLGPIPLQDQILAQSISA